MSEINVAAIDPRINLNNELASLLVALAVIVSTDAIEGKQPAQILEDLKPAIIGWGLQEGGKLGGEWLNAATTVQLATLEKVTAHTKGDAVKAKAHLDKASVELQAAFHAILGG